MLYEIENQYIQQQMIYAQNQMKDQNPAPTPKQLPLAPNSQPLSAYINQLKNVSTLFKKKAPMAPPIVQPTNKSTNTHVKLGIRTSQDKMPNPNQVQNPNMNPNTNINNNHVHTKQCQHNHPHNHTQINMHRPLTQTWLNPSFVLCNVMLLAYGFTFIYEFIAVSKPSYWIVALVLYLILYFIVLWCYYKTVCSQPGPIPFFYGLSTDKNQQQHRKYCMLCHNFKPQRSHHCSRCQKCILNMDHHCPWINNCVGFNNRKYFLQFLFYLSIGLIYSVTIQIISIVDQTQKLSNGQPFTAHYVIKWLVLIFSALIGFLLIIFFLYHLGLVLKNVTTLQLLINKKKEVSQQNKDKNNQANDIISPAIKANVGNQQNQQQNYNYNVGKTENFMQVFGENPFWWFVPLAGDGPKGNGTEWPKAQSLQPNIFINNINPVNMNEDNNYNYQAKTTTTLPQTVSNRHQKQISSSVRLGGLQQNNHNAMNLEQTYQNAMVQMNPSNAVIYSKPLTNQPNPQPQQYYMPVQYPQVINHQIINTNGYPNQPHNVVINYNNNRI